MAATQTGDPTAALVNRMRFRPIVTLVLLLMLAGHVYSQILPGAASRPLASERQGTIRGNVVMPDGSPLSEAVKITLKAMRGDVAMIYTDQQGRFELGNLTPAQYTIEIDPNHESRFEVTRESVQIQRGGGPTMVTLYLKEKQAEARVGADKTISVGVLDQKVPSAAKKEYQKASHFIDEGNALEAIAALKRAIAIYPDYLAAHNDLGAQLLEQQNLDEAANELRAALKIDPKAFNPHLNLGIVLIQQKKYSEALTALDQALSMEPSAPAPHLYAGMASVDLNDTARGEKELNTAHDLGGKAYAVAFLHLGNLYMKKGDREMARRSFESYLRELPDAADAAQIEKLIDRLR
jgi:tetratricopeptide (TPR) repeat protein